MCSASVVFLAGCPTQSKYKLNVLCNSWIPQLHRKGPFCAQARVHSEARACVVWAPAGGRARTCARVCGRGGVPMRDCVCVFKSACLSVYVSCGLSGRVAELPRPDAICIAPSKQQLNKAMRNTSSSTSTGKGNVE
jgi:hypothetical protein